MFAKLKRSICFLIMCLIVLGHMPNNIVLCQSIVQKEAQEEVPEIAQERQGQDRREQKDPENSDDQTFEITKYSRVLTAILLIELLVFVSMANNETKTVLLEQVEPKNLLKNIAQEYCCSFITTMCHEFGHAGMAKLLNGDAINVHIGASPKAGTENTSKSLLSLGGVHLDGVNPTTGYALYSTPLENAALSTEKILELTGDYCSRNNIAVTKENIQDLIKQAVANCDRQEFVQHVPVSKKKQAAILLAGGMCGIIGNLLMKFGINFVRELIYNSSDCFKQKLLLSAKDTLTLDHITINQLFNMFMPFQTAGGGRSDASKLYAQCLHVPEEYLDAISPITPYCDMFAEWCLVYADRSCDSRVPVYDTVLITFLNYCLRGYVRLHA